MSQHPLVTPSKTWPALEGNLNMTDVASHSPPWPRVCADEARLRWFASPTNEVRLQNRHQDDGGYRTRNTLSTITGISCYISSFTYKLARVKLHQERRLPQLLEGRDVLMCEPDLRAGMGYHRGHVPKGYDGDLSWHETRLGRQRRRRRLLPQDGVTDRQS